MRGTSGREKVVTIGIWGSWRLDFNERLLVHVPSRYLVDFKKLNTCAGMLDIIFQVRGKDFISAQDTGDLVNALYDLFDPQENLCSLGEEKQFDAEEFFRQLMLRAIPIRENPQNPLQ